MVLVEGAHAGVFFENNLTFVNNKVPVYLETGKNEYSEQSILCDPLSLTKIGYIDWLIWILGENL